MAYNPGGQPPFNPQAPFGVPPPPPPKAGMSTGVKVAIFGCIGLVFLGAIIAIVAVAIGVSMAPTNSNTVSTGSNTSSTTNTSSSPSTKNANTAATNTNTSGITVASIDLATDDNGQPGSTVQSFSPTDNPMHFVIKLSDSAKGTKVRVVLKAVSVSTGDRDTKVGELDYELKPLENRVNAQFELPKDWPTGSWRLEVYINGALDESRDFQVS